MLTAGLFMVVEALHAQRPDAVPVRNRRVRRGPAGAAAARGPRRWVRRTRSNNLPAYLALEPVGDSPVRLAALLIGVNLGPLVTPWASLATLLWHERLRTLNVEIRWGGFAVAGLAAVVLTVPLAVVALWLTTGMH